MKEDLFRRSHAALRVIFFVLSALSAHPNLSGQNDSNLATISGVVINSKTSQPIQGARVVVSSEAFPSAARSETTDANGRFLITGLQAGRYSISATQILFFRPKGNAGPAILAVSRGERVSGIQLFLSPAGTVSGRVTDDRRDVQRGVLVEALRYDYRDGMRTWLPSGQTRTDDRGQYRLFNLPAGNYYIRATSEGGVPIYYPNVDDEETAIPTIVESGVDVGSIDIQLHHVAQQLISFKLPQLSATETVTMVLNKYSQVNERRAAKPEHLGNQNYRISLPRGDYEMGIQVSAMNPLGRVLTSADVVPIKVGNADQDLGNISIRQTVAITGRLITSGPVPVRVSPELITVTLRPFNSPLTVNFSTNVTPRVGEARAVGEFMLSNVAVGQYRVTVAGLPPDAYWISTRQAGREILDKIVTVMSDAEPLEIGIGGPSTVSGIQGNVVDPLGRPLAGKVIFLAPNRDIGRDPTAVLTAISDQLGNFSFKGIIPAEYRLFALDDNDASLYFQPESLKQLIGVGEILRLEPGALQQTVVRITPSR